MGLGMGMEHKQGWGPEALSASQNAAGCMEPPPQAGDSVLRSSASGSLLSSLSGFPRGLCLALAIPFSFCLSFPRPWPVPVLSLSYPLSLLSLPISWVLSEAQEGAVGPVESAPGHTKR